MKPLASITGELSIGLPKLEDQTVETVLFSFNWTFNILPDKVPNIKLLF